MIAAAAPSLGDFIAVALLIMLALSLLMLFATGGSALPAAPTSITSIGDGLSWLMLVFYTPGAITTYYTELFPGQPSVGGVPLIVSSGQAALFAVVKLVVPLLTCFTLKKASAGASLGRFFLFFWWGWPTAPSVL